MVSWRDTASPVAQADLDEMLGTGIGLAQQELAKSGSFVPFAVVVDRSGRVALPIVVAEDSGQAADVLDRCRQMLSAGRDDLRAAAMVFDAAVGAEDVVQIEMEHSEGQALVVMLPYARRWSRRFVYGSMRAAPGEHRIWP